MDGDNSLDGAAVQDFNEMANVGSTEDVAVVVLVDRKEAPAAIYKVEKGVTLDKASPLLEEGEIDMGNYTTLKQFVEYGVSNFPAERIALIFWNHGDGWRSPKKIREFFRAASYDEDNGNGETDPLYMWEVVKALSELQAEGVKVNLIGFDECLMGMAEVAVDVANYTDNVVFSETTEPYDGWDYGRVLRSLIDNPEQSGEDFAKEIVDNYYEAYESQGYSVTLSAVNVGQIEKIREAINSFVDYYMNEVSDKDQAKSEIMEARSNSLEADDGYGANGENTYVDLKSLFENISLYVSDSGLKQKAEEVVGAINAYVRNTGGNYSGMSIYFPKGLNSYEEEYGFEVPSYSYYLGSNYFNPASLQWNWDEFIQDILE